MTQAISNLVSSIKSAQKIIALTGAGISISSGIPPFRGKGGVWEHMNPMEYAHIRSFLRNPEKVWREFLAEMGALIEHARPNPGHKALALLEKHKILKGLITQNVDGLHQMAGNQSVIELHGSFAQFHCIKCNTPFDIKALSPDTIPPTCPCGEIVRPDCVFFGEPIPPDTLFNAEKLVLECDMMLLAGTSASVYPAAALPEMAKQNGAIIVEINPEKTPLTENITDLFFPAAAEVFLVDLLKHLNIPLEKN